MESAEFGLVIKFEDQSINFTAGYECGMIHMDMERRVVSDNRTVLKCNKETITNICKKFKRKAEFSELVFDGIEYDQYLLFTDKPYLELVK